MQKVIPHFSVKFFSHVTDDKNKRKTHVLEKLIPQQILFYSVILFIDYASENYKNNLRFQHSRKSE